MMERVIKIPEKTFEYYVTLMNKGEQIGNLERIILDSKPLPKEHGRIMDVDKVIKKIEEREEQLKDDRSIWETAGVETALDMFGETIIEADKESEEQ